MFVIRIDHINSHLFRLMQRINHLDEDRHHFIVCIGETDSLATRPGEPRRFVRFPLGRHTISLSSRTIVVKSLSHAFLLYSFYLGFWFEIRGSEENLSIDIALAYVGIC